MDRALVIINLSSLDLFAEESGYTAAQDLAMKMVDAVRSNAGPVYVVDQRWPISGDISRPRANFKRMVELARDVSWIHYDENNEIWEYFLKDLATRLHEDGVTALQLGGVWFDPAGKVGAVAEAYHALTGQFNVGIDEDLVGPIPGSGYKMSGASMGATEGWAVTHDGETMKAGLKNDGEAMSWLHKRHSYSVDHAVEHEGYDIVLIKDGHVTWSYKRDILERKNPGIKLELDLAKNMFGHLDKELRKRLERVVKHPMQSTWEDAYTIILEPHRHTTLWQAVIAVDPAFPRTGPASQRMPSGKRKRDPWAKIPSQETLIAALKYATH